MKQFIPLLIILAILMGLGTIYDHQIALFFDTINSNQIVTSFTNFFNSVGGIGLGFITAFSFSFFANFGLRNNQYFIIILSTLAAFIANTFNLLSIASFMQPNGELELANLSPTILSICIPLGIILTVLLINLFTKINDEDYHYYRNIAFATLTFAVTSVIIINGLKYIWARPRFEAIDEIDIFFKHWFSPSQMKLTEVTNSFKSFPSGHTANSIMLIALTYWTISKKKVVFYTTFTWGVITAFSRVVATEHFITDVTMSIIISILIYLGIAKLFKLNI